MSTLYETIIEATSNQVADELIALRAKSVLVENKDYIEILNLIFKLKFHVDFRFCKSQSEIQQIYDELRTPNDNGEYKPFRFILDLSEFILYRIDDFEITQLANLLSSILTSHNRVNRENSCYDNYIIETMSKADWEKFIHNNAWFIGAYFLTQLPTKDIMYIVSELDVKRKSPKAGTNANNTMTLPELEAMVRQ